MGLSRRLTEIMWKKDPQGSCESTEQRPVAWGGAESEGGRVLGKAGGSRDSPRALGCGETRIQGTHLPSQTWLGEPDAQAGWGRMALEKTWPEGIPWVKVEPWKMGTPSNSGEDEVIPAEANQSSPLGRQRGFYEAKCSETSSSCQEGKPGQPGPMPGARGPHPGSKKRLGAGGGQPRAERGGLSDGLLVMGHALEKPVRSWSEAAKGAPCTRALCLLFSPKKDKRQD